jgi:hypothetical protein
MSSTNVAELKQALAERIIGERVEWDGCACGGISPVKGTAIAIHNGGWDDASMAMPAHWTAIIQPDDGSDRRPSLVVAHFIPPEELMDMFAEHLAVPVPA